MNRWLYICITLMFNAGCCLTMEKEKKQRISEIKEENAIRQQLIKAISNYNLSWIENNVSKLPKEVRYQIVNSANWRNNALYAAVEVYTDALRLKEADKAQIASKIFERLLEYGADINRPFKSVRYNDVTLLEWAVSISDPDGVKLLLDNGADFEQKGTFFESSHEPQTPLEFINNDIKKNEDLIKGMLKKPGFDGRIKQIRETIEYEINIKALLEEAPIKREAARKKALEQELKAKEGERLLNRVQQNPSEQSLDFLQSLKREGGDIRMKD